jgi:hypothetical protein
MQSHLLALTRKRVSMASDGCVPVKREDTVWSQSDASAESFALVAEDPSNPFCVLAAHALQPEAFAAEGDHFEALQAAGFVVEAREVSED